jgi:hypothetical protein
MVFPSMISNPIDPGPGKIQMFMGEYVLDLYDLESR